MTLSTISLPSNRKFGFFFTLIFGLAGAYFFTTGSTAWACALALASVLFLAVTVVKPDILFPLNKLWMRFGFLLGMIVSPIVLGIIYFGLFTPVAFGMRLFGRDELSLKFNKRSSQWISRNEEIQPESFKNQF
jgi:hypothetical protein